jgi:hypothetical protein
MLYVNHLTNPISGDALIRGEGPFFPAAKLNMEDLADRTRRTRLL